MADIAEEGKGGRLRPERCQIPGQDKFSGFRKLLAMLSKHQSADVTGAALKAKTKLGEIRRVAALEELATHIGAQCMQSISKEGKGEIFSRLAQKLERERRGRAVVRWLENKFVKTASESNCLKTPQTGQEKGLPGSLQERARLPELRDDESPNFKNAVDQEESASQAKGGTGGHYRGANALRAMANGTAPVTPVRSGGQEAGSESKVVEHDGIEAQLGKLRQCQEHIGKFLSQRRILVEELQNKLAELAKETGEQTPRVAVEWGHLIGDWDALVRCEWNSVCLHKDVRTSFDRVSPELGAAVTPAPPSEDAASPSVQQASTGENIGGVLANEDNDESLVPDLNGQEVVESGGPRRKRRQKSESRETPLAKRFYISTADSEIAHRTLGRIFGSNEFVVAGPLWKRINQIIGLGSLEEVQSFKEKAGAGMTRSRGRKQQRPCQLLAKSTLPVQG